MMTSRKRLLVVGLRLTLSGLVGAILVFLVVSMVKPRRYEASAFVVFPSSGSSTAGPAVLQLLASPPPEGGSIPISVCADVLQSRSSLVASADALQLARIYKLKTRFETVAFLTNRIRCKTDPSGTMVVTASLPGTPRLTSLRDLYSGAAAAQRDDFYRALVPQLVDALLTSMKRLAAEIELDRTKATVDRVRQTLEKETRSLDLTRLEITALERSGVTMDPDTLLQQGTSIGLAMQRDQAADQASLQQLVKQRDALRAAKRGRIGSEEQIPSSDPALGPTAVAYRTALAAYQRAQTMYGPESAAVLQARSNLEAARAALSSESRREAGVLSPDLTDLEVRIEAMKARQAESQRSRERFELGMRSQADRAQQLDYLLATREQQRKAVADLQQALRHAEVDQSTHGIRWSVLDPPEAPIAKSGPNLRFGALLGFLLGTVTLGWRGWLELANYAMATDVPTEPPSHGADPQA